MGLNLQRTRKIAEIFELGPKQQIPQLCERQKDDEIHHSEPRQVLGTTGKSRRQLGHRFVKADIFKKLERRILNSNLFQLHCKIFLYFSELILKIP